MSATFLSPPNFMSASRRPVQRRCHHDGPRALFTELSAVDSAVAADVCPRLVVIMRTIISAPLSAHPRSHITALAKLTWSSQPPPRGHSAAHQQPPRRNPPLSYVGLLYTYVRCT